MLTPENFIVLRLCVLLYLSGEEKGVCVCVRAVRARACVLTGDRSSGPVN